MEVGAGITTYDAVVAGLFALLIGRGIWLGFLKQITGLLALYLGYIAASQYHDRLFPFLRDLSNNPKVVFLASCIILFCLSYVVVMLLGKLLHYVIQITMADWFDRLLGAVIGFAKALILVIMMHMVLGAFISPESQMLKACQTYDLLNQGVDLTRQLIRSDEVRKALKQQEPAISLDALRGYISSETKEEKPAVAREEVKPQ